MESHIKQNNSDYDSLTRKTWITKGTRFAADERLRAKHRWSTLSLAMLSLYLVALSSADMLDIAFTETNYKLYVPVAVIFLSVFILIISLIENSRSYILQADKMYRCALEIQSIYDTLQLCEENQRSTCEERINLLKKYTEILRKYPNHEQRDYKVFRANNYKEKNFEFCKNQILNFFIAKFLLTCYWISDFWMYCLFIFGPLSIVIIMLFEI